MNKRTEQTRWTPKRLLSLLMALIMTLSLLPTAALAADDYSVTITDNPDSLFVGQTSGDINATLTAKPSAEEKTVRLKITVHPTGASESIATAGTIQYFDTSSSTYKDVLTTADATAGTITGYLDAGPSTLSSGGNVSATFRLKFDKSGYCGYTVEAFEWDTTAGSEGASLDAKHSMGFNVNDAIESLTVVPTDPEAGQPFTVRADTNVDNGHVAFTYNGDTKSVPVSPLPDTKGYAEYTFIANTGATGDTAISATLFGVAGISDATKTATVNVGMPATYHTVTFHENAAGVYNMPPSQTVENGQAAVESITPQRDGYTFDGWYKDAACTTSFTLTTPVTEDLHLYAGWKKVTYLVSLPYLPTGVTAPLTTPNYAGVGDTVTFNVTVPDKYDTTNMLVSVGDPGASMLLAPKSQHTDPTSGSTTFYYLFEVKDQMIYRDTAPAAVPTILILVNPLTEKTFTVMMPTGHFDAEITGATPAPPATGTVSTVADNKKSASIVYGGDYTFTVTPDEGYDVAVYVNSVKQTAGADGKYTVKNVTGPQSVVVVESAIPNYNVTFTVPLSGQSFMQSVARGKTATKPGVAPEREGYTFAGWYTEAEYNKDTGAKFNFDTETITEDTVLYGKLTPNTYTITYDLNGASGTAPTAQTKKHGQAVPLSTEVPTREGFTFLGWGTSANATAASYQPGDMYSVDGTITLYAVWKINKYTVTLPGGAGYTTAPTGTNSVDWGSNFTFTVIVDREYAAKEPTVKYSTDGGMNWTVTDGAGAVSNNSAATWTYTIQNVKTNYIVSIDVARNTTYTVSFITATLDNGTVTVGDAFLKQSVEHGYYAPTPAAPERVGFKFLGYYAKKDTATSTMADYESFPFEQQILKDTNIYAIYAPITPAITWTAPITADGYTIEVKGTKAGETTESTLNSGDKVAYGSKVTFTITVAEGYDASKMQVGVNGILYAPNEKNGNVYTYEFIAKEDTKITVTGIERKTITINYFANAGDDVASVPGPQTDVKYYINETGVENSNIINFTPVRTGYNFLGWCENPAPTGEKTYNNQKLVKFGENAVYQPGDTATFTKDTNLYAIWEATELKVDLTFSDTALHTGAYDIQYEGKTFTLNAQLNARAKGSMIFKMGTTDSIDDAKEIGRVSNINGDSASLTVTTDKYITPANNNLKYYWVEFQAEKDEGFTDCKAGPIKLKIFSRAITWAPLEKGNDNTLTIKQGNETKDSMIAGQTYTLAVDTSKITGLETLDSKQPVLGTDYKIVWQYKKTATSDWETVNGEFTDTNEYQVTPAESGYEFRAKIYPMGDLYNTAAKFDADGKYLDNQYDSCLYTNTTKSNHQATATTLTIIGAENESKDVWVNGDTPFTATGEHKAQFEGQKVTLTATVTDDNTTKGVTTGHVDFYRKGATTDTLLNASPIAVGANGVATCEVTISNWDTTKGVTENKDEFYAVYLANATYDTSNSKTTPQTVYIKSTAIKTPIIDSTLANEAGDTATTYNDNLTGLLAGVQHEFKLRQTGAEATTGDWSVVALDGRTVAAKNYDIEWQYKTNGNFAKADNDSTAVTYTTTTTKVDDRYRVKLTGKGVFAGSEVTSKDAVIGTKQNVTVTVEATDAITKTPVDRENGKYPDVYQLNEITLTATVAAANDKPTMQPTGTVTFYYKDGDNWVKLDSAMLAEDTNHSMTASITTNKLPVTDTTNTWRNVEITAVYEGNDTFNASGNYDATNSTVSAGTTANGVTDDTVTVYSSVVFNCNDENKKQPTDGDKGIHISVSDGAFKTNEKATLALSDIYTLDRELTDETLRNTIAKLDPDTDYTVRWQKLNGATAIGDAEGTDFANSKRWTDIGATGTTLVLDKVEQNTAYRAVITVANPATPIVKGSFEKIDQGIVGEKDANDGRQVYYSNVLMPTDTNMTVSVALNTSKIGAENTEGITEGETVTANVYLSGVVGAVPNANVTVTVTNDDAKGNGTAGEYKQILGNKNTVNGWNAFDWDTTGVAPGFYTLTVSATTNTGYAAKEITRSLIVRESSYTIVPENTTVTYNGRTQGLTVALNGFGFNGTGINEAANKSWTVKYYDKDNNLVEPTQAGTYRAVITLPASAYWTEQTKTVDFTIEKRSVSIADAIAQAKVYDGTTDVNIVEVMLNDAETEQGTTGWLKSGENTGIINGDSIYAVATAAVLEKANAGENKFTISAIDLLGDDANNYVWDKASYTENIYVSRSQVYGEHGTLELKQGETFPADKVIKMIDQSGREITLGTGTEDYTLTFYYHSDTKIEKTTDISKLGLYTVVARPNQSNYKSGVTMQFTVVETATVPTPATTPKASTLITISNTAELYGAAGNNGIQTSFTNSATLTKLEYQVGTGWTATAPTDAGRYLVKVTASTGDVAYGIYTITKAHPSIDVTPATGLTYNSMPQNGYTTLTGVEGKDASKDYYITYAGDVAIGYNVQKEGNVDEQAPVDAGTYTVTLHVNETANYTAHEISKSFTIAKKALTIKADSWQTTQYDAFPDMTAGYTGLAAETGDTTPDTSLRDVQIAPEFLYNPKDGKSDYNNVVLDSVGYVAIQPIDALSKNYAITYENGQYTKQRTDPSVKLDIHGLPQSGTGTNTVYYGDVIQLYPYGYYTTLGNGSGILEWSVTTAAGFKGKVTIGKETGLLNVNGVGDFTVTLKRGVGEQQIETKLTVTALKKEVKVHVADQDKVYSGSAQTYSGEVKAYDELYATVNAATTTPANNTRTDIGTQITTSRIATGSEKYQSLVYGGKFTINDKDATVAPVAQSTVYGTLETFDTTPTYKVDGKAGSVDPVTGVNVASQTDAYNRLDVHDGYEILVAGTEDMNYNVKYTTDETAEDSAVTTYGGETFTSKTTKELNDATVYGETPNVLDWTLVNVIGTTRDSVDYADNLADFDLPDTFVWQDKDDCTGNKVTYKAANRTTEISGSTVEYNQVALTGPRTSTDTATDENYTLKFNTVENSGKALLANNYKLTNVKTGNSATTTNALTANSKGFIPAAGESNDVSGENFVEGSANIAQRPIKLEKAVTDAQLYWRLPQSQLYTALVNVLKAEENSVGRGLAKGHTIEDLDLSFTIGSTPVDKNNDQPMTFTDTGKKTVTVTVGDTNYKLEGGQYQFDIVLKNIQIEATYTTKTFTGFTVLIKVHNEGGAITPLNDAKGLSYKIFKKTGDTIDKTTAYASGTLTYQNRTAYDDKGGLCGVFTATYPQLPLLNSGETYFIQMYEYGVELKTNS